MAIHNTTSAVTLTRDECQQAVNVLRGLATAIGRECPAFEAKALDAASEALQGLLDGFSHLVLRENDDE